MFVAHACTGPFWHKVNSIFVSVNPEDAANLKQQVNYVMC